MAFFLGFIPELGFIAQFVVSLPVVVFSPVDSNGVLDGSTALWNLKCFIMGSFAIKLVINNVIETIVMKSDKVLNQGGQEVHAVLILFLLALGGEVWGCVGMLLAVPGISLGRLVMRLADDTIRERAQAPPPLAGRAHHHPLAEPARLGPWRLRGWPRAPAAARARRRAGGRPMLPQPARGLRGGGPSPCRGVGRPPAPTRR
ncbi:unnamed protein product [Prorocentrum cordatum]|uniref:Uncharacterized protein n=1 Tax=Prorocentrum cordatum TaxID=2364126 RepID=A0ABN9T035_9DINO|nr:unnamed protein product [Polarella glacialis]